MKLKNPFSQEVKALYIGWYKCFLCGSNEMLEIHHIYGRTSACAFNSSCLCHECHSHVGHTQEERRTIFGHTLRFLFEQGYNPNDEDWAFLKNNWKDLSPIVIQWRNQFKKKS